MVVVFDATFRVLLKTRLTDTRSVMWPLSSSASKSLSGD